ncbi:MAG: hypothetical protein H0W90_13900 [Actinobacteria bacterium]|nr:hypothetical protein [Actinomycetota bacterium]
MVFAIAGAVKLKEETTPLYRLLGGVELLTAAAIAIRASRGAGLAAGAVLGLGFIAYWVAVVDRPSIGSSPELARESVPALTREPPPLLSDSRCDLDRD